MFLPFFLYAEVHHKFSIIPNFLYQKEPEIIADFPRRLEPDVEEIPFVINVKDANKFPIVLKEIYIKILRPKNKIIRKIFAGNEIIRQRIFQKSLYLKKDFEIEGDYPVIVEIYYFHNNHERIIENHNYKKAPRSLWYINFSRKRLPGKKNWYPGDIHWHSIYTEDDVEFGQSLENAVDLAKSSGLYFLGVTDHSYDLDDEIGKYREKDEDLIKWKTFKKKSQLLNEHNTDFVFLDGEEVSTGNSKGKNIHVLIFDNDEFIQGTGDSTDKPFNNSPDSYLEDFYNKVDFSIAAHPFEGYSLFPRLFLKRDKWEDEDLELVDGIQFYNGIKNDGYIKGKNKWIEMLLKGKKIYTYGGTDAHGDFNRAFKVKIPFLKIVESKEQIAGNVKTYVYCTKSPNKNLLLKNLKKGRCIVSDGPFLDLKFKTENYEYICGDSINEEKKGDIVITMQSSKEFGELTSLSIYKGILKSNNEILMEEKELNKFENIYKKSYNIKGKERIYIRAEIKTSKNKTALTNPLFINY